MKRKYNSKIYDFIINILQDEEKVPTFACKYLRNKMYVLIFFFAKMRKGKSLKSYVPPQCTCVKMEDCCHLCSGSLRPNAANEEDWHDGGTIIDETIEV